MIIIIVCTCEIYRKTFFPKPCVITYFGTLFLVCKISLSRTSGIKYIFVEFLNKNTFYIRWFTYIFRGIFGIMWFHRCYNNLITLFEKYQIFKEYFTSFIIHEFLCLLGVLKDLPSLHFRNKWAFLSEHHDVDKS